jgi:large subunit ribosomal protein L11
MAKEVKATLRMLIPGGAATPAPPVGAALGQQGVNIMDFCKQFNAKTADRKGQTVPVVVTVYTDKKFDFVIKTTPVSELIKKKINIAKGVSKHKSEKAGTISMKDILDIAKVKMPDLNAHTLEQAAKIIAGSARSMGVEVVE